MEEKYDIIDIDVTRVCQLFSEKFDGNLKYSIERIPVDIIKPTSIYLQESRLQYATKTAAMLKSKGLDLYAPHIKKTNEAERIVPPPIIEERGDNYVLCDGTHRITVARNLKEITVIVLVVRGVYKPLAGDITSWDTIRTTSMKYRVQDNFINFNKDGMTGYSKFCNSTNMEIWRYQQ